MVPARAEPGAPFSPAPGGVGFEQWDVNAWDYNGRFCSVPGGIAGPSGRDGSGIVCFIASASSSGVTSATNLEIYVFDANNGGNAVAVTPGVTNGTANALNHMYMSVGGNVLAFQRSRTTSISGNSRTVLNGDNDLGVVINLHEVLQGAPPDVFWISQDRSHGHSVAFVGEGTPAGPGSIIFSDGASGGNSTWDQRRLQIGTLSPSPSFASLDNVNSFYEVIAGGRLIADDPTNSG